MTINRQHGASEPRGTAHPFKLVSRQFKPERTVVDVGGVRIGGNEVVIIAGPCSVESREQLLSTARAVKASGAHLLRGGAYKPRTSPYDFQGLGEEGLRLLSEARAETGLPIVTEVMSTEDVDLIAEHADMLQIGARNMQNFALLRRVAVAHRPILLKRGPSASIREWLLAAEYLVAGGNPNVVLCERGIRTFEPEVRNTFDVAAIALARELSHLPVIADPSHATGRRDLIIPLSRAAVALGADGIMVEVHPCPELALSDGPQSLDFEGFRALMRSLAEPGRAVTVPSGCAPGSRSSGNAVPMHEPERARTLEKSPIPARPAETQLPSIRQMTVFGTGLIGGSLALAARQRGLVGQVVGCDREEVLAQAQDRGAIDAGFTDPLHAAEGSQVVVLAAPVGQILDLLERLGPKLPPETLLTDVGSTKAEIVRRALEVLGKSAARRFLPGHPMAGKERSGIEQADGALFRDAVWFLTPLAGQDLAQPPLVDFVRLLEGIGARVVPFDPERHDRLCAWISHLPQMLSTVLASTLADFRQDFAAKFGGAVDLDAIGGRALRETTRLASSPYSMWRDIVLTNTENIEQAMLSLEQHLAYLRENLRTGGLREEFERANQLAAEMRRPGL